MGVEIKRLSECTWNEAVTAWNRGFEGYFLDMTTDVGKFQNRLVMEGISPERSLVAFDGDEPVGIICNGFRQINGQKVAWNGGTGIAVSYRGTGVSKQLMQANLDLYQEEGVETAYLEALSQNTRAISLYEKFGYKGFEELLFFQYHEAWVKEPFADRGNYSLRHGTARDVANVSFYHHESPWQTHWASLRDGESYLACGSDSQILGYALFRRVYNEKDEHVATVLMQCEPHPDIPCEEQTRVLSALLARVFSEWDAPFKRTVFNLSSRKKTLISLLETNGFTQFASQLHMRRFIK